MRPCLPLVCCLLLSGCISPAQLRPYRAEASFAEPPSRRPGSVEDSLRPIHSRDRDYGGRIEDWRARAVRQSLGNTLFWTMLTASVVLVIALATVVHQRNQRERQEIIAAELLAQYHNAWVHASRQARDAIDRHNALVEKTNRANEAAELLNPNLATTRSEAERESTSSPASIFLKGNLRPRSEASAPSEPRPGLKPRNLRQAEPDLLAQLNTLQQQLDASCERERNLERELKKASQRRPAPEPRTTVTERTQPFS